MGETSVVKRGRKLVFKSVGRVLAARDVTAGAHRGGGAAARDGSRILRGGIFVHSDRTSLSDLVLSLAGFVSCTSIFGARSPSPFPSP